MSEFSPDLLTEYVDKNFRLDRVSLSGVGVDEQTLVNVASDISGEGGSATAQPAKYFGGESRECTEHLQAYTVLVGEGAR